MNDWNQRAEMAQASLDHFFGAPAPQLLHNTHPAGHDDVFNYWWLAHVIDCKVDGYYRSGDRQYLRAAEAMVENIRERNGGDVFNDYFDDMLWLGLALLRLHIAGGRPYYRDQAVRLWNHVNDHGWNGTLGESLSWRKQSPEYKNAPANGPLVILGYRLAKCGGIDSPERSEKALEWLQRNLVTETGFVHDGVNREGDGQVDTTWRFSYNQGLYIAALLEAAESKGSPVLVKEAQKTARTALEELASQGVFVEAGEGPDVGLFKGICMRYMGLLYDRLELPNPFRERLERFIVESTDQLWEVATVDGGFLRPGDDWREPPPTLIHFSTLLSGIMATELRARLEEARPADVLSVAL